MPKEILRKEKSGTAGIGYALIVGLIAVVAIAGVQLFGGDLLRLFGATTNRVSNTNIGNSGDTNTPPPPTPQPTISTRAGSASIPYAGSTTIAWSSTHATSLTGSMALSGSCNRAGEATSLSGLALPSGSFPISWSIDTAGCQQNFCLTAINAAGQKSSCAAVRITPVRTIPDQLSFPPETALDPGSQALSASRQVTGIDVPVVVTVNGGEASAGRGWANTLTIDPESQITLRATAPQSFGAHATIQLAAGSMVSNWSIVTRDQDTAPAAFSFPGKVGLDLHTTTDSDAVSLSSFDGPLTATCTTPCTAIARNGVWGGQSVPGFMPQDTIAIRAATPEAFSTMSTASVTVGDTSSSLVLTSRDAKINPTAFSFVSQTNAEINTTVQSEDVTLSGFDGPLTASCSAPCVAIARNGIWGGQSVSGFVPQDQIAIKVSTAATFSTATDGSVAVGTTSGSLSVKTRAIDTTPNSFSFSTKTGLDPNTSAQSDEATLDSFDGPLTATCAAPCTAIARNGIWGGQSVSGFMPKDKISIKSATSGTFLTESTASVAIGGATATFQAVTRDANVAPAAFSFATQSGLDTNAAVQSEQITLSGFDGPLTATCAAPCTAIARNGIWGGQSVSGFMPQDKIAIKASAAATFSTPAQASVIVGSATGTLSMTTRAIDTTPNSFSFSAKTNLDPSTSTQSDDITLDGFDGPLTATCAAPCTAIAKNGVWGGQSVSGFMPQDKITIKATTPAIFSTTMPASVTIGNTTGALSMTTRAIQTTPAQFTFQTRAKQDPSATVTTQTASALTGFDTPLVAYATNGALLSTDGVTWQSSGSLTVASGQTLYLQMTSASAYDGTGSVSTTVTIGTTNAAWSVDTKDLIPNGLSFASQLAVAPGSTAQSIATMSSFDGPLTLTFSNSSATYSIQPAGGSWAADASVPGSLTINPGASIRLTQNTTTKGQALITQLAVTDKNGIERFHTSWSVATTRDPGSACARTDIYAGTPEHQCRFIVPTLSVGDTASVNSFASTPGNLSVVCGPASSLVVNSMTCGN